MSTRFATILLAATFIGCTPATQNQPDSGPSGSSVVNERPAAMDSTAHVSGFGPVRAGMTLAEAERAIGSPLVLHGPRMEPCHYVVVEGWPGVAFMIIDGRIARADIQPESTVKTAEGAGIGDTEGRIQALYPERVEVQPHKYTDGHYLIVTPEADADSLYRMIFETDGKRVTKYRVGRLPEVRWVEGCS